MATEGFAADANATQLVEALGGNIERPITDEAAGQALHPGTQVAVDTQNRVGQVLGVVTPRTAEVPARDREGAEGCQERARVGAATEQAASTFALPCGGPFFSAPRARRAIASSSS